MTTFNTGNPIGSIAVKDLYDNAENLDVAVNSEALTWLDRGPSGIKRTRKTFAGIEADARNSLEQTGYIYTTPLNYASGITITLPNQIFNKDGEYYKAAPGLSLPYVTTGNWATESVNFRSVGDAALRSGLASASTSLGVSLVRGAKRVVNTVADMLALPSALNPVVETLGYYVAGDGGGGATYRLNSSDTTTASDGGAVQVAADGGRYYLDKTVSMDIRQWGVRPVGTTGPDTALQIQKAANWTAAHSVQLIFAGGYCRALSAIEIPSNSDWYAAAGSGIYLDPAMAVGPVIGGVGRCIYGTNKSNIRLTNMEFYSTNLGTITKPITICLENPTGLYVRGCNFHHFGNATNYAQGLIVYGGTDVRVHDSKFNDNSGDGCALSYGTTEFTFDSNQFMRNRDWGLALVIGCNDGTVTNNTISTNISTGTGTDRCANVTFMGNTITGNEHGIRIAEFAISTEKNKGINIIGNNILNSDVAGISIEGSAANFGMYTVCGNTVNGTVSQGIRVVDADGGTISNNTVYSSGAEAILFLAQTSGRVTGDAVVSGNTLIGCTRGIRQVGGEGTTGKIIVGINQIVSATIEPMNLLSADYLDMSPTNFMTISKPLNMDSGYTSISAAGGGAVLPGAPVGFYPQWLGGVKRLVPYYAAP